MKEIYQFESTDVIKLLVNIQPNTTFFLCLYFKFSAPAGRNQQIVSLCPRAADAWMILQIFKPAQAKEPFV